MRMAHYYQALALLSGPCLLLTLLSGAAQDGSQRHLVLGLFTAVLCVATNTLLILFMIVSGRVLRAAMQARELSPGFLGELNQFFARRRAYPLAIGAAFAVTAAAALGHGHFIGVPAAAHVLAGLAAALLNALAWGEGLRALRANQGLLDRAAAELDRLDAAGASVRADPGPPWAFSGRTRWLVFASCAWAPYLYWALVVWRGAFERVPPLLLALSGLASMYGILRAWRARASAP